MKMRRLLTILAAAGAAVALCGVWALARSSGHAAYAKLNVEKIQQFTGAQGMWDPSGTVFRVSLPREDLAANVAGARLNPPMGIDCWAAFQGAGDACTMVGRLALRENQVNPVISSALANGLEVTALHNEFLWDSPRVMLMRISGLGGEEGLAEAVGRVFSLIRTTEGDQGFSPRLDVDAANCDFDPRPIESILGARGDVQEGCVYRISIERTLSLRGQPIGGWMGASTWASFAGSDERAIAAGDFVVTEEELQPVLKALRQGGIHITAIQSELVLEQPRALFVHFWGVGSTAQLARGIKAALVAQAKASPVSGTVASLHR